MPKSTKRRSNRSGNKSQRKLSSEPHPKLYTAIKRGAIKEEEFLAESSFSIYLHPPCLYEVEKIKRLPPLIFASFFSPFFSRLFFVPNAQRNPSCLWGWIHCREEGGGIKEMGRGCDVAAKQNGNFPLSLSLYLYIEIFYPQKRKVPAIILCDSLFSGLPQGHWRTIDSGRSFLCFRQGPMGEYEYKKKKNFPSLCCKAWIFFGLSVTGHRDELRTERKKTGSSVIFFGVVR